VGAAVRGTTRGARGRGEKAKRGRDKSIRVHNTGDLAIHVITNMVEAMTGGLVRFNGGSAQRTEELVSLYR